MITEGVSQWSIQMRSKTKSTHLLGCWQQQRASCWAECLKRSSAGDKLRKEINSLDMGESVVGQSFKENQYSTMGTSNLRPTLNEEIGCNFRA